MIFHQLFIIAISQKLLSGTVPLFAFSGLSLARQWIVVHLMSFLSWRTNSSCRANCWLYEKEYNCLPVSKPNGYIELGKKGVVLSTLLLSHIN